jgi:hypothetical protein
MYMYLCTYDVIYIYYIYVYIHIMYTNVYSCIYILYEKEKIQCPREGMFPVSFTKAR